MSDTSKQNEKFTFQAEVAQVLDIVINSLYTDKEIFVRELISNAADALEKVRHLTLIEKEIRDKDAPLEIRIELDEVNRKFTISDTGIGMTREELINNLGNIAHSGATEFIQKFSESIKKDVSLIGQFGVGFYATFMVAERVTVQSRSADPDAEGYEWRCDGGNGYEIAPKPGLSRGTKIILELKPGETEFSKNYTIRQVIKKFSNFVPFPIYVDGEKINTIQALWTRNKSEISEKEYIEFYKFISGSADDPLDWLHFSADAPLAIHALLFIPKENFERLGFGKLDSNIDLHCRKVLIQKQAKELLPTWLRFLRGIVDSEDLPLNISRETMQDSALIRKLNKVITSKFIKHLDEMGKDDPEKYLRFWKTFGMFIKEGIITDYAHKDKLADLLRFQTSKTEDGVFITLNEYVERMKPDQKDIYFITGLNREAIEAGPYLEVFRKQDIEVIYNFEAVDEFVMMHLGSYKEKKLVSADSENLDLPDISGEADAQEVPDKAEVQKISDWIRKILQDKVKDVRESRRLTESPVILVNPEGQMTSAMQQLLVAMGDKNDIPVKRTLEFNPGHPLIKKLYATRETDSEYAEMVLNQIYDQAAITAGLAVDTREMIQRMYAIISHSLDIRKE